MEQASHEVPSFERALELLIEVSGTANLSATTLLLEAEIDSLDFIEWMTALELDEVDLDDAILYELLEEGTVTDLYEAVVRSARSS